MTILINVFLSVMILFTLIIQAEDVWKDAPMFLCCLDKIQPTFVSKTALMVRMRMWKQICVQTNALMTRSLMIHQIGVYSSARKEPLGTTSPTNVCKDAQLSLHTSEIPN